MAEAITFIVYDNCTKFPDHLAASVFFSRIAALPDLSSSLVAFDVLTVSKAGQNYQNKT